MASDLLINRRVVKNTALIAGTLTAGSLLCTLIVMAFQPSNGENVVLALSLALVIPLVCSIPVGLYVTSQGERLAQLNALLEHEATHDALTDLPNRRAFFDALERRLDTGKEAGLLLIDADRFKSLNDSHGHHTGDEALKALARLFAEEVPAEALVARLGGEEFGALLPDATLAEARDCAESLRQRVSELDFRSPEGASCPLSISIGIDVLRIEDRPFPLKGADHALYAAKQDGRNRVSFYSPPASSACDEKAA
ncbi:GGDEF domain-containing protein [Qipengyuania aquimaris]|uniref:diguanylate cyclase n=1 Tax=Qipengyuania aquimaris TaxID=255984 RepID=A0A9Q3S0G0_9SPHN|nr:GGDEF domain-containing protein [Qipengyuania aquimaris]MBY6217934.1 GGDEF domain-containing protein [Qipengyuania aquimaris]